MNQTRLRKIVWVASCLAVVAWIGFSVAVTAERPEGAMMQFDHIGVVTTDKKPGERFVSATRVWVTDFQTHPFHVEWLRYEPDSPVKGPVRTMPHVAYRVDNIAKAAKAKNLKVLLEPFDGGIAKVGFFQTDDGAVVELMEYDLRKTK